MIKYPATINDFQKYLITYISKLNKIEISKSNPSEFIQNFNYNS